MLWTGKGHWYGEPFVQGSSEAALAAARVVLVNIGFTESAICAGAGIAAIAELGSLDTRPLGFLELDSPLSLAVQLFMDGADIPWDVVRKILMPSDLAALEAIGVLLPSHGDASRCVASVSLYPLEDVYVASDRHTTLEHVATEMPADLVYSALTKETQHFLRLTPRKPCTDYLELCSGTGIAALIAARDFAERAVAVDITARSTRFAEFNAAFNGLTNVRALQGDLYAPVAGQTFDMISAHPPYVPSTDTVMVFRDGGEDGEQITRAMIAGLPAYLRPGGQFHCDCMMTDRRDAPLEGRIREMLGPLHTEFDVFLGQLSVMEIEQLLAGGIRSERLTQDTAQAQRELFARLEVEQFVTASFIIQRRASPRTVVTRRRIVSTSTRWTDMLWYLNWATTTADWERGSSRFLDARPTCSPQTELTSRSVMQNGRWSVTASSLRTHAPFSVEAECPAFFATLLSWCDGRATARELLTRLRNADIVPDSIPDANFATLISELTDGGLIELDSFPHR